MHRNLAIAAVALLLGCSPSTIPEPEEALSGPPAGRQAISPAAFTGSRPYSPGVRTGNTLYVAGQIGRDPASNEIPADIAAQTRRAMDNVQLVLTDVGMDFGNVVSCRVQLVNMDDYAAMNAEYGSYFEEGHYPARTTLQMALVGEAGVEITCTAYADKAAISVVQPEAGAIPAALGPYSPAVWAGDTLYLSGQGGADPKGGPMAQDAAGQATQTLANIQAILAAANLTLDNVIQADVFFVGCDNASAVEGVFASTFQPGMAPARGMFCLSRLPGTISVEITFAASRNAYAQRLFPAEQAPESGYSPATLTDGLMITSASIGVEGDVKAQMRAALEESKARLALGTLTLDHVAKAYVYLTDAADFAAMNEVFVEAFPNDPPARTTVVVNRGPHEGADTRVRVELIAVQ